MDANLQVAGIAARVQEIEAARRVVDAAGAELRDAEWRLAQRTLTAPAGGRIEEIIRYAGETAGPAAPVLTLLPPDNRKLKLFIPQAQLSQVRVGDTLALGCDGCAAGLQARIDFIASAPEFTPPVLGGKPAEARGAGRGRVARRGAPARARADRRYRARWRARSMNVIDVSGLTKRFGDRTVVDNISLRVREREIVGFLGPNGSGKTTIIRMLCGVLVADLRRRVASRLRRGRRRRAFRRHIGYMTQKFTLYEDLTIRENLEFVARMYGLARDGRSGDPNVAWHRPRRPPRPARRYALRRLEAAARARGLRLIHEPQLLLLDEPTAGIDPLARRDLWDSIPSSPSRGVTLFVTTHYMDEAERCTDIGYIMDGEILADGTIAEVARQDAPGCTPSTAQGPAVAATAPAARAPSPACNRSPPFGDDAARDRHRPRGTAGRRIRAAARRPASRTWAEGETSLEDLFIHLAARRRRGGADAR